MTVVVLENFRERRETAVVIEASLLMGPKAPERGRPVGSGGRAFRLEVVDSDFLRGMQIVSRLRVERRHVTRRAFRLSREQLLATLECRGVEGSGRRPRRGNRQLIEVKGGQLRRDP